MGRLDTYLKYMISDVLIIVPAKYGWGYIGYANVPAKGIIIHLPTISSQIFRGSIHPMTCQSVKIVIDAENVIDLMMNV